MKTYPYHTPEGIIQLVEKRELDQLIERLAEARESHIAASARDVQTIQRQSVMMERLAGALRIIDEYPCDFTSPELFYRNARDQSRSALSAYESAKGEAMSETPKCTWSQDEEGYWQTSCKQYMVFEYTPPFEQGYKYCHHCGKPIHFIKFTFLEDDEL